MSKRRQVLEKEKELIRELQKKGGLYYDPDFMDDELPGDFIEAVTKAEMEYIKQEAGSEISTGQSYRPNDADEFPFGTYIQTQTGRLISRHFRMGGEYQVNQTQILELIIELGYNKIYERSYYGDGEYTASRVYEKNDGKAITLIYVNNIVVRSIRKSKKVNNNIDVHTYSNDETDTYDSLLNRIIKLGKIRKHESNNIGLVIQTPRGYGINTFELPKQTLDIELNYGSSFKPVHEKIITQLNQKKGKGLVLLHGTPGTGKTHYLKYLASKIENKKVLFIPPFLADFITSPEMTPFLIDNANSVLFIEDAERVITDRQTGGANGVSNILNLTDGILSDILNIQIVATFNMDKAKIDSALLRKGRLIAEHKFDALTVEDANALLKHLGKEETATKPMTLTEIYNIDEAEYKSEDKYTPIGFNIR